MKRILTLILLFSASLVQAQEADAFLACEAFTDRAERVACLEKALDEAVSQKDTEDAAVETGSPAAVNTFGEDRETADVVDTPAADPGENESRKSRFFRLPSIGNIFHRDQGEKETEATEQPEQTVGAPQNNRVESFGTGQAKVVENEKGREELHDVIASVRHLKPNLVQVTLESGQVWNQVHVRRFMLREGDPVRIYPTGWGTNFRLETDRLSGFIQVERVE